MAAITFNVKPVPNGDMQIIAIIRHAGKRIAKYTGHDIPGVKTKDGEYKHWNKKTLRVRGLDGQDDINAVITDWQSRFADYKKHCTDNKKDFDIERFKRSLSDGGHDILSIPDNKALLVVIQAFLADNKSVYSPQTYSGYRVLEHQLTTFQNLYKRDVMLADVNEAFYKEYAHFLISVEKNSNNSVKRKLTRIVTVMNYAFSKGYVKDQLYKQKPYLKGTPSRKVALLPDELKSLHDHKITNPLHEMVCDAFLLACYSGLRHSDVLQLKPIFRKTIRVSKTDIEILELTQVKGTKQNTIPLDVKAAEILDKRTPAKDTDLYFRAMHGQAASRILKDIFDDAKLSRMCEVVSGKGTVIIRKIKPLHEIISFHMGRNTYITSLLASGVPTVYVKDNAGHSDIRTTMNYSKQDDFKRYAETLKASGRKIK